MKKINNLIQNFLDDSYIDAIDIAVIDFKSKTVESKLHSKVGEDIFFDLASLSKPLTNGIGFLAFESEMTEQMQLVLNHRGSLPSWGLLSRDNWKEQVLSYPIQKDKTLYSDFSALRFMLEFNKTRDLHLEASKFWDRDLFFWKDLKQNHKTIQNGFVNKQPNYRSVHDPNAYNINDLVSHAGLFGTAKAVGNTLLTLSSEFNLISKMHSLLKQSDERFINGWDRVQDPSNTLAGSGASPCTFGHLGFTGTSIWIDCEKNLGYVLLSNATKYFWYDKKSFNLLRREIGKSIWES